MKPTISPHFSYDEVIHSDRAIQLGIDNNLPIELFPKVQLVADMILENVRQHFGKSIKITSWWRCPALNQMISNNPNSQHTKGEAVDFIIPGVLNMIIAEFIRDNLAFDQLILERNLNREWIHCSFVEQGNRMEVLHSDNGRTYEKGLKGNS